MESQPGFKAWLEHCHLNHLKNGHRLKCCFREFVKRNDTLPGREVVGAASSQIRAPRPLLGNLHIGVGGRRGQGDHGEGGPGSRQHRGTGGAPGNLAGSGWPCTWLPAGSAPVTQRTGLAKTGPLGIKPAPRPGARREGLWQIRRRIPQSPHGGSYTFRSSRTSPCPWG